jgi:hypothetical protein
MSRQIRRRRRPRGQGAAAPSGFGLRPGTLGRKTQVILVVFTVLLALAFALGTPGLLTVFGSGVAGGP